MASPAQWPTWQEARYLKSNTIRRLVTHEGMQAPLRFLRCFALQPRRSVAVFQHERGRARLQPAFVKLWRGYITKRTTKKAQSIMLWAFKRTNLT